MTEKQHNDWIRQQLKDCDVVRIENSIGGGMPDFNVCYQGKEVWIESKVYLGGRVLLRPQQFAWGVKRWSYGGRVFVIASHPADSSCHIWKFPITVCPHGKYVAIQTFPALLDCDLKSFLFTPE